MSRSLFRSVTVALGAAVLTSSTIAAVAHAAAVSPSAAASRAVPATATAKAPKAAAGAAGAAHRRSQRVCAKTTKPGAVACDAYVVVNAQNQPLATATPSGFGPASLQSAYNLPSATAGSGKTIAIVDAYRDPTAESDMNSYRSTYGLPSCTKASGCFTEVNQTGGTSLPATNASWGQEISLDLDMASATCPRCNILLVDATSPTTANLGTGVNTAASRGAIAISNSYGGSESSSDASYDSSYYNHPGVAITASSGDNGYGVEYPAASRYVTAVGGTSLTQTSSNARGWSEAAWSGAGSGCSADDAKPSFQTDSGCSRRTVADVSAVADPATGVAVYDTTAYNGSSGWLVFGGTSASSPIVAGVYALGGGLASGTWTSNLYSHASSLNDVTSGSNGSCSGSYLCTAKAGYDGPTGLGTPNGTGAFGGTGTSPSPTPTPTPTPGAQLIGNPGFENGTSTAPWVLAAGVVNNASAEPPHSGAWDAWFDGYGTTHTDTGSQSVAIPAGISSAKLALFLHVDTSETTTSSAYDTFSVQLVNSSGSVLKTLGTYSNLNALSGYASHTYDVSAYAVRPSPCVSLARRTRACRRPSSSTT